MFCIQVGHDFVAFIHERVIEEYELTVLNVVCNVSFW